ncbi:MAG: ATP-binding protein [Mariprofundaceae bacterium]
MLAFARGAATRAGMPERRVRQVMLALCELVANIARHAYRGEPGEVEISADANAGRGELVFILRDHAPVRWEAPWARIGQVCPETGEVEAGGLGMRLIYALSDRCEHEILHDGNRWVLAFRLRGGGATGDEGV